MGIENFIKDALHNPNDYVAYHVGRELAELHPRKAILEGETGYFDLEAFVRAEKCCGRCGAGDQPPGEIRSFDP